MTTTLAPLARTLATMIVLTALATGPALAGEPSPGPAPGARVRVPLGGISPADCAKQFAAFDANRDGKLTYQEYAGGRFGELRFVHAPSEREVRGHKAQYTRTAHVADPNRDGWLSRKEHATTCAEQLP